MEPTIHRGSIVIIDPVEKAINKNAIYGVRLDDVAGACAIRRVKENRDFWFCLSDNPDFEPIVLDKKGNPNLIIGRVIWSRTNWLR